jgi:hypothetical protein
VGELPDFSRLEGQIFDLAREARVSDIVRDEIERRAVYSLMENSDDPAFPRLARHRLNRPSPEATLAIYWPHFRQAALSSRAMDELASALLGQANKSRSGMIYGTANRYAIRACYPAPEIAAKWLNRVNNTRRKYKNQPVALAGINYAQTVLHHPYPDGNGRMGRAMIHAALAWSGTYHAPFLPVNAVFLFYRHSVILALEALSWSGDWRSFLVNFGTWLGASFNLLETVTA